MFEEDDLGMLPTEEINEDMRVFFDAFSRDDEEEDKFKDRFILDEGEQDLFGLSRFLILHSAFAFYCLQI